MEKKLYNIFSNAWSKETCFTEIKNIWNEDNKALGQCAITTLAVNDLYGGKIMICMVNQESHYYNLVNNKIIDLTSSQFNIEVNYDNSEERSREYLLSNKDTKNRYMLLLNKIRKNTQLKDYCIKLRYENYDNIEPIEEIEKINLADEIYLNIEPTNKKCLFLLGILFAAGKKIKILNEKDLNLTETTKSFTLMSYVWSKLLDNNFPNSDFSNIKTEMDIRIENIKRLGVSVNPIISIEEPNKMFIICPVRVATDEQKKAIEDLVTKKEAEGCKIHAPHLHTVQTDMFGGFTICLNNANAVATSSEIYLNYDQTSKGSVFDLGIAYFLQKPLELINSKEIKFDESDFMDNVIKNWPNNNNTKTLN